jgi:hypothetical protein
MSWDKEEMCKNQIFVPFSFFKREGGNGKISESLNFGKRWMLNEIRVHFSTLFLSVEYLVCRISTPFGSGHSIILLSSPMSGSTDVVLYYSTPRYFLSDEQLIIELSCKSGLNTVGINAIGWAVTG